MTRLTPPTLVNRTWNWIDDAILPYALAAMRAVWVWLLLRLWSRLVAPGLDERVAPLTIFGLLAASMLFTQLRMLFRPDDNGLPWFLGLSGLGAVTWTLYLTFGAYTAGLFELRWLSGLFDQPIASVSVLVLAATLWRWGILTGREPVTYDTIVKNFVVGVLVLASELTTAYVTGQLAPIGATLFPLLLIFFGISLSTLAIASLQSARSFERWQTGQSFALNRYWLGTVGLVIGVLILIALLLGNIFASDATGPIRTVMATIVGLLVAAVLWMVRLVFLVLYSIYEWILRVIFSRGDSGNPLDFRLAPGLNLQQLLQDLDKPPTGLQLEIFNILKAVSILIVAALIIVAFILAVRRLRARRIDDDVEETRDTILSLDLLKEQLANLFSRKNQHAAAPEPFIPIIGDDARSQIRRTYQSLLAWAAERGVPRPPGLTPSEYSMLISRELSIADTHAETITSAYLEARYSPAPILPARADEVVRAWTQIESVSAK